eukprot:gene23561-29789_t
MVTEHGDVETAPFMLVVSSMGGKKDKVRLFTTMVLITVASGKVDGKTGEVQGQGTLTYQNGESLSGRFDGDRGCVSGMRRFINGDVYEGEFCEGEARMCGVMIYKDGSQYNGLWDCGMRHGAGTLILSDRQTTCTWDIDKPSSSVHIQFNDGSVHEGGADRDGLRQDFGTTKFTNGDIYTGNWLNDKMDGEGTMRYANGAKFTGLWKENTPFGAATRIQCCVRRRLATKRRAELAVLAARLQIASDLVAHHHGRILSRLTFNGQLLAGSANASHSSVSCKTDSLLTVGGMAMRE